MGRQCRGHAAGSQTPCRRPAPVLHPQRTCIRSTFALRRSAGYSRTSLCTRQPSSAWERYIAPTLQVAEVAKQQSPTLG